MEYERKVLDAFVKMHAHKIPKSESTTKGVYLCENNVKGIPIDCKLTFYTLTDVAENFDTNSPLNRWVIEQIQKYDEK